MLSPKLTSASWPNELPRTFSENIAWFLSEFTPGSCLLLAFEFMASLL